MTPLLQNPAMRPFIDFFKCRGAGILIFLLIALRGMHGIPEAIHLLAGIGKGDIGNETPTYSPHDLWLMQSGLWSMVAFGCIVAIIVGTAASACRRKNQAEQQGEQGAAPNP